MIFFFQDVRAKVLSATREVCHYLQSSQGNGAAVLRQICANFQVRRILSFLVMFTYFSYVVDYSGDRRCGGYPLRVPVYILREQS